MFTYKVIRLGGGCFENGEMYEFEVTLKVYDNGVVKPSEVRGYMKESFESKHFNEIIVFRFVEYHQNWMLDSGTTLPRKTLDHTFNQIEVLSVVKNYLKEAILSGNVDWVKFYNNYVNDGDTK